MTQDYGIWEPVVNYTQGRSGHTPKWIVIHGTAGGHSAEDIVHYFNTSPHSVHYIVDRDGRVIQCVRETDEAWGNGIIEQGCPPYLETTNPNNITLSIEHVKPSTDNSDELTPAQAQSSFALVKYLCEKYGIPKRAGDENGGIIPHSTIAPISRAHCPGPYPWNDLYYFLNDNPLSNGWHDNGVDTLTAPNGEILILGFREWYLQHTKDLAYFGLPLEHEEQHIDIYDNGTLIGSGSRQVFEYGALAWVQGHGIWNLKIGELFLHGGK